MLKRLRSDHPPDRTETRTCIRALLDQLASRAPGRSVEIRIPPYAAVQAIEGVEHRRGTPAAVVEMDALTFLELVNAELSWAQALTEGRVQASGERSDLTPYFPFPKR
jgi:hypothetical protein